MYVPILSLEDAFIAAKSLVAPIADAATKSAAEASSVLPIDKAATVDSPPVQTTPVQTVPVQTAPVQTVPAPVPTEGSTEGQGAAAAVPEGGNNAGDGTDSNGNLVDATAAAAAAAAAGGAAAAVVA